jgi:pre-mRNA-splicing factor SPF27
MESTFAAIETGSKPAPGIDLSRYEPSSSPPTTTAARKEALVRAYTTHVHVSNRIANLSLLDTYGRNAWLIGNESLEQILGSVEKELAEVTDATERVNRARREAQENVRGEFEGLEKDWRRGVGRVVETEIAGEELRQRILQSHREA